MQQVAENKNRKKLFRWIKIVLLIYGVIGIIIYYAQDLVILHPVKLKQDHTYSFAYPHTELNIAYDKQTNINIIRFKQQSDSARGVVLYFHGNKNNIQRYAGFVPNFTKNNYEVWMIDYPGFGKSTGSFSEETLYEWSLIMYNIARKQYSPSQIIIYGKSLGTGVAAQLASVRDCKTLVLETPYYSMTSLAGTYLWMYPLKQMIHYKLPTYEYLKKVTAPVLFFHGTADRVIPYSNAAELKNVMKPADEFVTIEGGRHTGLNRYDEIRSKIDSVLNVH